MNRNSFSSVLRLNEQRLYMLNTAAVFIHIVYTINTIYNKTLKVLLESQSKGVRNIVA